MRPEQAGSDVAPVVQQTLDWNGAPFEIALPVHRSSHVLRTKPVTPAQKRSFSRAGWPPEYVLLQEHRLKLVGYETTLAITTHAVEAECELPGLVLTPVRENGIYYDAKLYWHGREERGMVTVRLNNKADVERIEALVADGKLPPAELADTLAGMAMAQRTISSGLIVSGAGLPDRMSPEDRQLANLLMTRKDPTSGAVHSLREIARTLNCSHETVRRRILGLFSRHPELKRPLLALRSRNGRGVNPAALIALPADD